MTGELLEKRTKDVKPETPEKSAASSKPLSESIKVVAYVTINIISGTGITFANKVVFSVLKFRFVFALTLLHVLTTIAGLYLFAKLGWYQRKKLPLLSLLTLSAAFVGYLYFWNASLQISTVGFTQLCKICVTPGVMILSAILYKKLPTLKEVIAVVLLCIGVALSTVADSQMSTNFLGIGIAITAIACTAVYQVWAGSKQKELEVGSMALMAGYTPIASVALLFLVITVEPIGLQSQGPNTLLGYPYTITAVGAILLTCILGFVVSLSTFLVIGATSSTTFTVLAHLKSVIVLIGGFLFFGENLPPARLAGIMLALFGIGWYTQMKLAQAKASSIQSPSKPSPSKQNRVIPDAEKQTLLPKQ